MLPMLHTFLESYWNQLASEFYRDFDAALAHFRDEAGVIAYDDLLAELRAHQAQGRFPRMRELSVAYSDPFWAPYERIILRSDVEGSALVWR